MTPYRCLARCLIASFASVFVLSPQQAISQSEICTPLTKQLFDATDTQLDTERRSYLCSAYCEKYRQWRTSSEGSSVDLSIGYQGFSLGVTDTETFRKNAGFFHELCTKNESEFYLNENLRRTTRFASGVIANAFVECVRQTSAQGFFAWIEATDEETFTLHIRNKRTGDRSFMITRFQFKPDRANVQCSIPEVVSATGANPFPQPNVENFDLVCSKNPEVTTTLALITSESNLTGVVNGTDKTVEEMRKQLAMMGTRLQALEAKPQANVKIGYWVYYPGQWKQAPKTGGLLSTQKISFDAPFSDGDPTVILSVVAAEMQTQVEYVVRATNIRKEGFDIEFWGADMRYADFVVQWVAIGGSVVSYKEDAPPAKVD